MGPMHLMVFFLLGLTHFSLGKVCPGCFVNSDADDSAVNKYLSEKLRELKTGAPKGMENEKEAELVRVKSVKKQIVAGIQYKYEFEVRGLNTKNLYDCSLTVFMPPHKQGKEQVTEYRCHVVSSNENKKSLLGGQVVLDVENNNNLEELKPLISAKIATTQNSKYSMTIIKYFKATMQVVAGTLIKATVEVGRTNCFQNEGLDNGCMYQIQDRQVCDVEVLLKPWMNVKEVIKVQCKPQPKNCFGCPFDANPNQPDIQQILTRTLSNHNAKSLSSEQLYLVKINKATTQYVAGMKYTLDFETKSSSTNKVYSCKAVIVSQPWISEEPLVDYFNCTPV